MICPCIKTVAVTDKFIHTVTTFLPLSRQIFDPVGVACLKPVLDWANVCSPNILRTVRQTMIRFLIEILAFAEHG